jgi:hypothetical protein
MATTPFSSVSESTINRTVPSTNILCRLHTPPTQGSDFIVERVAMSAFLIAAALMARAMLATTMWSQPIRDEEATRTNGYR